MSDEEPAREEVRRDIPPFRFSKSVLEKLCQIIQSEYALLEKEHNYYSLELTYVHKDSTSTYHNIPSFLDNLRLKELESILFYCYSRDKRIRIQLTIGNGISYASISSTDPNWAGGMINRFNHVFQEYELSLNKFFHSKNIWVVWSIVAISLLWLLRFSFPASVP